MVLELEGELDSAAIEIGIAVSRWNEIVTRRLLDGAIEALADSGLTDEQITVAWVAGAFELPLAAQALGEAGKSGVVALGCVIRGETDHYTHVATETARGLMRVSLDLSIPVGFGVLTTENLDQALERAGRQLDNKGFETAQTVVQQIQLLREIKTVKRPPRRQTAERS